MRSYTLIVCALLGVIVGCIDLSDTKDRPSPNRSNLVKYADEGASQWRSMASKVFNDAGDKIDRGEIKTKDELLKYLLQNLRSGQVSLFREADTEMERLLGSEMNLTRDKSQVLKEYSKGLSP